MGNPVCIDTDILIDHLRGRNPGAELYARFIIEGIPYTTYITKFELLCSARSQKEERIISECLLGFKILSFDERSSYEGAKIYRDLKRKGRLIGIRDILIAGIAIANQLPIATKNINDFKRIKGLVLWKP